MMANWDLAPLESNLDRLNPALYLLVCDNDLVVQPVQGEELAGRLPRAFLQRVPGLGHLGHEERPEWFAEQIMAIADEQGLQ
jgi:magnesium chelatase accessory protein